MPDSPSIARADDARALATRVASRFGSRLHRGYARNKLRLDPAYAAVAERIAASAQPLLDVGCGLGLLGFYLREKGYAGDYLGIDFDARKVDAGNAAAQGHDPRMRLVATEAASLPEFSGHVALIDVLHYMPKVAQQQLLRDAAARVAPGALIIIRNVLREPGWRFRATVLEEHLIHAVRWIGTPAQHYPDRGEIEAPLRAAGLAVEMQPLWGRTPFNSYLIVARAPEH
ncbi:MAG: class I SAM-dependent methyltransferase [Xanthomonadales bacterium]|nr:class I SAM-dependent methyltransferase [Xanthomonadales bacterium]